MNDNYTITALQVVEEWKRAYAESSVDLVPRIAAALRAEGERATAKECERCAKIALTTPLDRSGMLSGDNPIAALSHQIAAAIRASEAQP